ncbi:MAG: hypothetical protein K9N00_05235 [Candidatus Marinimicrobia bacterium]|nr:hypothetical protein [Candidatus Neomarinimicrobiota bacterium]
MKKHFLFSFLIIFIAGSNFSLAQTVVGDWRNYTSTLYMQDVVNYEEKYYIATSGGLLTFSQDSKMFDTYKKEDGLSSLNINALLIDENDVLWLGMEEGEINFFDLKSQTINNQYIDNYDVLSFQDNLSNVTAIAGEGENYFVACQKQMQWGLLQFARKNDTYLYKDYYFTFPENLAPIQDILLKNDSVYVATQDGIFVSNYVNANLKNPEQWHKLDSPGGFNVHNMVELNGQLYAVANSSLYQIDNIELDPVSNNLNGELENIYATESGLWLTTDSKVYVHNNGQNQLVNSEPSVKIIPESDTRILGITDGSGLWEWNGEKSTYYRPNTLISNKYTSIFVTEGDQIAAASFQGLSFSTDKGWYNIVKTRDYDNPFKGLNINETNQDYFSAGSLAYNVSPFGKIWSFLKKDDQYYATLHRSKIDNSKKGGLLIVNPDQPQNYTLLDTTDNILTGSEGVGEGVATYLVPAEMQMDPQGNLWVLNQYAQNGNVIAVQDENGKWQHFSIQDSDGRLTHFLVDMAFENRSRIWFASTTWNNEPFSHGGIIMLDYGGTLHDKSDDIWIRYDKNDGLESNDVYSLDFDKTGTLWTMSLGGIQKATVSENDISFNMFNNGKYYLFSNLSFAQFCRLKTDQDNNVWFSTENDGMKIYSKIGEWLPLGDLGDSLDYSEGYTVENSELLSNTILDFDFNEESGKVYFATDKGISVLKYRYPVMKNNYEELTVFPSPFIIPRHDRVVIDGLLENSQVKILTLAGQMVRKISSSSEQIKGRQLHWNGRNDEGNFVGSGVYIVMAYNDAGENIAGKIAVIRK